MNGIGSLGKFIVFAGIAIVIFGLIIIVLSKLTGGRGAPLPGDIVIHRRNVTIYLPIVTSIVISVILTLLLMLISSFRR